MQARLNAVLGLSLACALCGCASMRGTRASAPPEAVPPQVAAEPAPSPAEPAVESDTTAQESHAPDNAAAPPCLPETKVKPKPRPRPKPVHKEAPPQPQTAPVVAENPPGSTIDAQVKPINMSVMSILGKKVQGPKGEDLGRVVDVLADATGRVRVAIIDFGGFLGVGNHRIAVDWPLLRFNPDEKDPSLLLSVSREKLKSTPEYKDIAKPQILMVPGAPPAATPPAATPPAATPPAAAPAAPAPAAPTAAPPTAAHEGKK